MWGLINLAEPTRQQAINGLLIAEVFLALCGVVILAITAYLKRVVSMSGFSSNVVNMAEGNEVTAGGMAGLDFLVSVGVISFVFHCISIKVLTSFANYKKREKRKYLMYGYQYLRFMYFLLFFCAPIISGKIKAPLFGALELSETELGVDKSALDVFFASYLTLFLVSVTLAEVRHMR